MEEDEETAAADSLVVSISMADFLFPFFLFQLSLRWLVVYG